MNKAQQQYTFGAPLPNVGFSGKMGAGKSTAAHYLRSAYGYRVESFMGPMKAMAVELWGADVLQHRERLNEFGTAVRAIDADAWVNLLEKRVVEAGEQHVVVDDVRTPDEYHRLRKLGFKIVRVAAPDDARYARLVENGRIQEHAQLYGWTESALDDYVHLMDDEIYNVGDLAGLRAMIGSTIERFARQAA